MHADRQTDCEWSELIVSIFLVEAVRIVPGSKPLFEVIAEEILRSRLNEGIPYGWKYLQRLAIDLWPWQNGWTAIEQILYLGRCISDMQRVNGVHCATRLSNPFVPQHIKP